ncbi:MAG TPA: hypothetical protein ENO09_05000 [bacterium]|nr:hypothetical protein [bacterium]
MNFKTIFTLAIVTSIPFSAIAKEPHAGAYASVSDEIITQQYQSLDQATKGKGYGPQSPRDIDVIDGNNLRIFREAPPYSEMNLCDIHFHKNAEHKGGEFTQYAGNGDGHGYESGYKYSGTLSEAELAPLGHDICPSKHGGLKPGDTIEVHYVYSTAQAVPGPTLGTCLSEAINNPQLRVEAQVFVLVNDKNAGDFVELAKHGMKNGYHQALNTPDDTGTPIRYNGSTTGPTYNTKGSPFQVSWSVRPKVAKVNAESVGQWCKGNAFNEDHAHGVRNLITNPELLSN